MPKKSGPRNRNDFFLTEKEKFFCKEKKRGGKNRGEGVRKKNEVVVSAAFRQRKGIDKLKKKGGKEKRIIIWSGKENVGERKVGVQGSKTTVWG